MALAVVGIDEAAVMPASRVSRAGTISGN